MLTKSQLGYLISKSKSRSKQKSTQADERLCNAISSDHSVQ